MLSQAPSNGLVPVCDLNLLTSKRRDGEKFIPLVYQFKIRKDTTLIWRFNYYALQTQWDSVLFENPV